MTAALILTAWGMGRNDKCARVFISSADIPFFTVETVEKMDALNGAPAAAPVYGGKPVHPLLLSHELFDKVLRRRTGECAL